MLFLLVIKCACTLGGFLFLATIAYKIFQLHRFKHWINRSIEQIPPVFPTGNFHRVLLQWESLGVFMSQLYNHSKAELSGFYIFHYPQIIVRSPQIIKQVLVSEFSSFHDRTVASDERADPLSANLLLTVKNPEWKAMRQAVNPAFTTSRIRGMSAQVIKSCRDFIEYLDDNHARGPFESKELCSKFATDIISSCAFGVDANCFRNEQAQFRVAGRKLVESTFINVLRQVCYFLLPSAVSLFRIPFFHRATLQFMKDSLLETIAYRESEGRPPHGDVIDILIDLKNNKSANINFHADRIMALGIQIFAAGFETPSATLSFTFYELALHPEMQEELRRNVKDLIGETGQLNCDNIAQLTFMDRFIFESMRKYPPIPLLNRHCNRDVHIDHLNVTIPKDTPVFISCLGLHHDEQYYPNPQKFDPDRFLPENVKNRPAFAYIPFGNGPHSCGGGQFAMMVMKLCLAHVLLQYKVEPCEETPSPIEFSPKGFILMAKKGIPLTFVKLDSGYLNSVS